MISKEYYDNFGIKVIVYYYTLKDLIKKCSSGYSLKLFECETLKKIIDDNFSDLVSTSCYAYDGVFAKILWQRLIAKYETGLILKTEYDVNMTDYKEDIFSGFKKFITKVEETKDKYIPLLTKLNESGLDLFGKVKNIVSTVTDNKFSDTPQVNISEIDPYVSNWTKGLNVSTNESDLVDIVERIRQYQDKFFNVMDSWCNDFYEIFIESLNV